MRDSLVGVASAVRNFFLAVSAVMVALAAAFTILSIVQYHRCSIAPVGPAISIECNPPQSRWAVALGILVFVGFGALFAALLLAAPIPESELWEEEEDAT